MQLNNLPGMLSGMPLTQSNLILLNSIYAYVEAHSSMNLDKQFSFGNYNEIEIKISSSSNAIIAFSNSSHNVAPMCFSINDYSFKTVWDVSALLASFLVNGFNFVNLSIQFSNGHIHDPSDYIGHAIKAVAIQLAYDAGFDLEVGVPEVLIPDTPLASTFYADEQLNLTLSSEGGEFDVGSQFTTTYNYEFISDTPDYTFDGGILTFPSGEAGTEVDVTVTASSSGTEFTFPIHITYEDIG